MYKQPLPYPPKYPHNHAYNRRDDRRLQETRQRPVQPTGDTSRLVSVSCNVNLFDHNADFLGACRSVDEFEKLNRVGEGTYGVVYRARDRQSGTVVALKKVRMEHEQDGLPVSSLREISLLKRLAHPNIVNVMDVVVGHDLDSIFLVMEYCEQDLATLLDNIREPYSLSEIKCLMQQLLRGLEYCHHNFIIHRDLKLSNLLITSEGILKIADFGLARTFGTPTKPMTPNVVTLWYRAPELLFGESNYTTAVDLWSVGCILGELLKNKALMQGKVELQQIDLVIQLLGTPSERIWPGFNKLPLSNTFRLRDQRFNNLKREFPNVSQITLKFLNGLLTYDPKSRLTARQALADHFFIESPLPKDPAFLPTYPEIRNEQAERARLREAHEEERRKRAREYPDSHIFGSRYKRR